MGICWPSQVLLSQLLAVLLRRDISLVFQGRGNAQEQFSLRKTNKQTKPNPAKQKVNTVAIDVWFCFFFLLLAALIFLTDCVQETANKDCVCSILKSMFCICNSFLSQASDVVIYSKSVSITQWFNAVPQPLEGALSQLMQNGFWTKSKTVLGSSIAWELLVSD